MARFEETTEDSSRVGHPGHDSAHSWQHFDAKYREDCIAFMQENFSKWAQDAEDAFQCVEQEIARHRDLIPLRRTCKFRTILCKLCVKQLYRIHNEHREEAVRKFNSQPRHVLSQILHPRRTAAERETEKLADVIAAVREAILDRDFDNGRHFGHLNERDLSLWTQVQLADTDNVAEIARRLGISRFKLSHAVRGIDSQILKIAMKTAEELHYFD